MLYTGEDIRNSIYTEVESHINANIEEYIKGGGCHEEDEDFDDEDF